MSRELKGGGGICKSVNRVGSRRRKGGERLRGIRKPGVRFRIYILFCVDIFQTGWTSFRSDGQK